MSIKKMVSRILMVTVVILFFATSVFALFGSKQTGKVGQTIVTKKYNIIVQSVKGYGKIGNTSPSGGGVFVVVRMSFKNISNKPIGAYNQPVVYLMDGKTKYKKDENGTFAYNLEFPEHDNSKIISNLNPGLTVNRVAAFEVLKSKWEKGKWSLLIQADKDIVVTGF
ncbi:MAG TPA: DUF4352 domain-containing protein [Spirochaetota bacterium]|nr:DUF4352 domain-containing protein [Spirochaetota bacterium]HQH98413.1 DUF4352 domain-containing protein [Spirochaetota bacterium]HQJ71582.1 DUF4352 domain-containing protein [Spirochaetota bacterium]